MFILKWLTEKNEKKENHTWPGSTFFSKFYSKWCILPFARSSRRWKCLSLKTLAFLLNSKLLKEKTLILPLKILSKSVKFCLDSRHIIYYKHDRKFKIWKIPSEIKWKLTHWFSNSKNTFQLSVYPCLIINQSIYCWSCNIFQCLDNFDDVS